MPHGVLAQGLANLHSAPLNRSRQGAHGAQQLCAWRAALVGTPTSGGLNYLRFVDLCEGYVLALPGAPGLGPRSLTTWSGHRRESTIHVPNPGVSQLVAWVDAQLEAARQWVSGTD